MTSERAGRPFDDLRRALERDRGGSTEHEVDPAISSDPGRRARTGSPEIVYAAGKTPLQVVVAVRLLVGATGRALASRCDGATLDALAALGAEGWLVETAPDAGMALVTKPEVQRPDGGGIVGIIAAGTSDLLVARETEIVASEVGCQTHLVVDVGVAGLHRLVQPLESMVEGGVDVIVVVAGMDGALPSVIAGLVAVPVIGVPTSTGYGLGGDGTGALMAMLQSCAPGLTVVNIDNGVGAAIAAGRIARRGLRPHGPRTD